MLVSRRFIAPLEALNAKCVSCDSFLKRLIGPERVGFRTLCPLFAAVLEKQKSRRALWDKLRSDVYNFVFESFAELWRAVKKTHASVHASTVDYGV
jgi:hypothetical protein